METGLNGEARPSVRPTHPFGICAAMDATNRSHVFGSISACWICRARFNTRSQHYVILESRARTWYHLNCLFLTPSFASATRLTASTFSSGVRKRASTGESGKRNQSATATGSVR